MNKYLLICIFVASLAQAQNFDPVYPGGYGYPGFGAGIGGPGAMLGGAGGPVFTSNNGATVPMFGSNNSDGSYNQIKPNATCPLLTQTVKEDQDAFLDIKNFLGSFSRRPECAQSANGAMMGNQTISMLESMIGNNSSSGTKCYSKNVELISSRNMAYYYAEKGIDQSMSSPFYSCNSVGGIQSKDKIKECISSKYDSVVEDNQQVCKEVIAPQAVQDQINKGMVELERLLVQSLSQTGACAPEAKVAFKATMNTFLKVKALSAVGPWGAMAGFGADLIGSLLDKVFPSDSDKATALMNDILSEDNFEQNACLYFNIQQKMYCSEQPLTVVVPTSKCNNVNVNTDMIKLLQHVKDIKKVTDSNSLGAPIATSGFGNGAMFGSNGGPAVGGNFGGANDLSGFESQLDDLTKYSMASEPDIRNRVKTLPKIQQSKELVKINRFYELLNSYQNYDPALDKTGETGQAILQELNNLVVATDQKQRINFEELVLKTTPGLKVESLKQRGIANAIEEVLQQNTITSSTSAEGSRSMAKYNKYKNAMGVMAKKQFESRLKKQFNEFEKQLSFVTSKEGGVSHDAVSEGMLRNIIRHCTLMQEIYDPNLEGKMPEQCEKLGCGKDNKLELFRPIENQTNFTNFKSSYCDKTMSYKKIEDQYVKDLNDSKEAKICGKNATDFFHN